MWFSKQLTFDRELVYCLGVISILQYILQLYKSGCPEIVLINSFICLVSSCLQLAQASKINMFYISLSTA